MNTILKLFCSMSCSGGLLILLLLLSGKLLRHKTSRQWQYYIWLIVILRLLLPFGPKSSLFGAAYQAVDASFARTASSVQEYLAGDFALPDVSTGGPQEDAQTADSAEGDAPDYPTAGGLAKDEPKDNQGTSGLAEDAPADPAPAVSSAKALHFFLAAAFALKPYLWLIWLMAALLLLIRRLTAYRSFLRYIKTGAAPVSDITLLDRLSVIAEEAGVAKPVELCIHPLVSSPLLIGFFRPCIVLPDTVISEADFYYTALHEITHYRRRDMFYKWLVQITVCLHWFNPLVYVMSREITRACEFSCDEAVLGHIGSGHAQDYGKTLLGAMTAAGSRGENIGAVTLSENKQLLKERLGAIMSYQKKSKGVRILTGVLTLCIAASAALAGVYPVFAKTANRQQSTGSKRGTDSAKKNEKSALLEKAEKYYKAGSLPQFQAVFSMLDEKEQKSWLNRMYTDDEIAFFSVALQDLAEDSPLIAVFAKKAYRDGKSGFFSILADYMDKEALEAWQGQALKDGDTAFQSILADKLDPDGEKDALEEKWAKKQLAEYKKYGITMEGKNYYYKGKLIRIFLDRRKTVSAYTLNINPKGTVDVKVVRNKKDEIQKVSYMTKEEVAEIWDMGAGPYKGQ